MNRQPQRAGPLGRRSSRQPPAGEPGGAASWSTRGRSKSLPDRRGSSGSPVTSRSSVLALLLGEHRPLPRPDRACSSRPYLAAAVELAEQLVLQATPSRVVPSKVSDVRRAPRTASTGRAAGTPRRRSARGTHPGDCAPARDKRTGTCIDRIQGQCSIGGEPAAQLVIVEACRGGDPSRASRVPRSWLDATPRLENASLGTRRTRPPVDDPSAPDRGTDPRDGSTSPSIRPGASVEPGDVHAGQVDVPHGDPVSEYRGDMAERDGVAQASAAPPALRSGGARRRRPPRHSSANA